jgi:hypothetical protein
MPAVAAGDGRWSDEEQRHLAGCAECTMEYELVRSAHALGETAGAKLDASRIGRRVTERLAAAHVTAGPADVAAPLGGRRWRRRWPAAAAAAAAALLASAALLTGGPSTPGGSSAARGAGVHIELAELETLDEAELETVLRELDAALEAEREDTDEPGPAEEPVTWEG